MKDKPAISRKGGMVGRRWITPLGERYLDARHVGYGPVTALVVAQQRVGTHTPEEKAWHE